MSKVGIAQLFVALFVYTAKHTYHILLPVNTTTNTKKSSLPEWTYNMVGRQNEKQEMWPRMNFLLGKGGALSTVIPVPILAGINISLPFLVLVYLLIAYIHTRYIHLALNNSTKYFDGVTPMAWYYTRIPQGIMLFVDVPPAALERVGPYIDFLSYRYCLSKYRNYCRNNTGLFLFRYINIFYQTIDRKFVYDIQHCAPTWYPQNKKSGAFSAKHLPPPMIPWFKGHEMTSHLRGGMLHWLESSLAT